MATVLVGQGGADVVPVELVAELIVEIMLVEDPREVESLDELYPPGGACP